MSIKAASKRLRELAKQIPDDYAVLETLQKFQVAGRPHGDHAIAMMGSAVVEKALEVAIKGYFVTLTQDESEGIFQFDRRGMLSDFSARIKMAYALGVMGPRTRDDLELVRQVRNAFAHWISPLDFDSAEVQTLCFKLNAWNEEGMFLAEQAADPRYRYIGTTVSVAINIKLDLLRPERKKLDDVGKMFMRSQLLP